MYLLKENLVLMAQIHTDFQTKLNPTLLEHIDFSYIVIYQPGYLVL
jgi:hypothetical protein